MTKPLTTAIEALTTYANTVTGASDQTLSEAVATLARGFGKGCTGFVQETVTVATEAVTGVSNNSLSLLKTLAPDLLANGNRHLYLFFFLNNSLTNKAALFGYCLRYNDTPSFAYGTCRHAGTSLTWQISQSHDFWYSVGTEIHVIELDTLVGM